MTLIEKLKALFTGNPEAEALIAQAEADIAAGLVDPAALFVEPVPVVDTRVPAPVDPVAPPSRCVTLRAAYDKQVAQ